MQETFCTKKGLSVRGSSFKNLKWAQYLLVLKSTPWLEGLTALSCAPVQKGQMCRILVHQPQHTSKTLLDKTAMLQQDLMAGALKVIHVRYA